MRWFTIQNRTLFSVSKEALNYYEQFTSDATSTLFVYEALVADRSKAIDMSR